MKVFTRFIVLLSALAWSGPALAQVTEQEIFDKGLRAEASQNWPEAVRVFKVLLEKNPQRYDLWLRISDIEAVRGNTPETIAALEKAARLKDDDANLRQRLSQAYAIANNPVAALQEIDRALALSPDNISYLQAQAQLAGWAQKPEAALDAYNRLLKLRPRDAPALLSRARTHTWLGHLDDSANDYQKYLAANPQNKEARLEYARVETWRGNLSESLKQVEAYEKEFGADHDSDELKARALAWASRPTAAEQLASDLIATKPNDYNLNVTRTLALANGNRTREAFVSLGRVIILRPDDRETKSVSDFVRTPLRSFVAPSVGFYGDSDGLHITSPSLNFAYVENLKTRFTGNVEANFLQARAGSGLEAVSGAREIRQIRGQFGVQHRFTPRFLGEFALGAADAQTGGSTVTLHAGFQARPVDRLRLQFDFDRGFYVISPRAVSLGIKRTHANLHASWQPQPDVFIDTDVSYGHFSDGNNRYEINFAPRRAFLRREKLNLDLGLRGWWYGFSQDLNNGYYDPRHGQSYLATSFWTWCC